MSMNTSPHRPLYPPPTHADRLGDLPSLHASDTTSDGISEMRKPFLCPNVSLYPIMLPLARTGVHIGEAPMLQAGDIDLGGQCTHIKRTWGSRAKANQEKRFNSPKGRWDRLVDTSE